MLNHQSCSSSGILQGQQLQGAYGQVTRTHSGHEQPEGFMMQQQQALQQGLQQLHLHSQQHLQQSEHLQQSGHWTWQQGNRSKFIGRHSRKPFPFFEIKLGSRAASTSSLKLHHFQAWVTVLGTMAKICIQI